MPSPVKAVSAVKNAPVTTLTTVQALVGATLTFLVTHQVIGNVDVSATTQAIAPFVALALPAVFGALKWRLVTPYAKVKDVVEREGLVSDADFARIDALLDDKLRDWGLIVDESSLDTADAEPTYAEYTDETSEVDGAIGAHEAVEAEAVDETESVPLGMAAGAATR